MRHTKRMGLALTAALLLAPALAGSGLATHSRECPDWVRYVPEDAETTTYPAYVTIDQLNGSMWSIWIYAESNGIEGLQRDDDYCYTPGMEETGPDTIVF